MGSFFEGNCLGRYLIERNIWRTVLSFRGGTRFFLYIIFKWRILEIIPKMFWIFRDQLIQFSMAKVKRLGDPSPLYESCLPLRPHLSSSTAYRCARTEKQSLTAMRSCHAIARVPNFGS
jgi:hypothetical protein